MGSGGSSSLLLVAGYQVMGFVMPGIDNLGHIGGCWWVWRWAGPLPRYLVEPTMASCRGCATAFRPCGQWPFLC